MKDVFISYVQEDSATALSIAASLEGAGYTTWCYERDSIPGLSYLRQTRQAIDEARSFLLLISPAAVARSNQVDKEVVHAHEIGRPMIPIFSGITFSEFQKACPDWHQAIGAVVGIRIPPEGIDGILHRVIAGLNAMGIAAAKRTETKPEPPPDFEGIDLNGEPPHASEPDSAVARWEEADEGAVDEESPASNVFTAKFVHEHSATGFLADLVITKGARAESDRITVAFAHALLGPNPFRVELQIPKDNRDPIQYLRLAKLIHGYPVTLRVHWLDRLPHRQPFTDDLHPTQGPAVQVVTSNNQIVSHESVGYLIGQKYTLLIPAETLLPHLVKKRFRTNKDNQKALTVIPAVATSPDESRELSRLRVAVLPGPAGASWVECTFRVDADGRFSVFARSPMSGMGVVDMVVQ